MEPDPSGAAEAFGIALRELRKEAGLSLREPGPPRTPQVGHPAVQDRRNLSRPGPGWRP